MQTTFDYIMPQDFPEDRKVTALNVARHVGFKDRKPVYKKKASHLLCGFSKRSSNWFKNLNKCVRSHNEML